MNIQSRDLSVVLPAVPPAMAPAMVGGPVAATLIPWCGPLQRVEAEPIYGMQSGLFTDKQVYLGNTEKTRPYLDHAGVERTYLIRDGYWIGHMVIYHASQNTVSSGSSGGVGGFVPGGGGNIGGSSSSGMSGQQTTIQLRDCIVGKVEYRDPVEATQSIAVEPIKPKQKPKAKPAPKAVKISQSEVQLDKCVADAAQVCRAQKPGIKLN